MSASGVSHVASNPRSQNLKIFNLLSIARGLSDAPELRSSNAEAPAIIARCALAPLPTSIIGRKPCPTAHWPKISGVRLEGKNASTFKLIWVVQSWFKKYSASRLTQIRFRSFAVSSPTGAYRDRHGRGAGWGGRGQRG